MCLKIIVEMIALTSFTLRIREERYDTQSHCCEFLSLALSVFRKTTGLAGSRVDCNHLSWQGYVMCSQCGMRSRELATSAVPHTSWLL